MMDEIQRKTFLSYSRLNKDFAVKLAKELKSEGFHIWLDTLDIPLGARWDREVERALKESEIFMIILTPNSVDSENVLDEIGYAIDTHKRILPIFLEDCDIPLRLRRLQYVDFTTKSFEEGVESAKQLLRGLIAQDIIPRGQAPLDTHDQMVQAEPDRLVQRKPADVPPVAMKPEPIASASAVQKKPISQGLIIGIFAVVVLIVVGIGFYALSNRVNMPAAAVTVNALSTETTPDPIQATQPNAVNPSSTPRPTNTLKADPDPVTNTPKVEIPEPRIYNFLACETEPCNSQNSSTVFTSRIETIYIHFDYENIDHGSQYTRTWTNNGEDWIKYSCAWDGPSSGSENIKLTEPTGEKGLRYGVWTVTITVNNVTLLRESINLTGNWAYWDPVPNVLNKCR